MMVARETRGDRAGQASILGRMPEASFGINCRTSLAVIWLMTSSEFGQSAYNPATSVSTTKRSADSATASAAAAVSAFTL